MGRRCASPLGALVRGALAGAAGTLAMDLVQFARDRAGGDERGFLAWELAPGLDWESAPAPAHIGKRLVEGLFQVRLPDERAALTNGIVHWAYGMTWGGLLGLVEGSLPAPRAWHGLPFGALVWLNGYVVLPLAKLYEPIWKYDLRTLAKDLGDHLVYGGATATTYRALAINRD
jgi:hypothetical protein